MAPLPNSRDGIGRGGDGKAAGLAARTKSCQRESSQAILLGLAPLARPHLLLLVPIAAFHRFGKEHESLWPVAVAACVLAFGFLLTRDSGSNVAIVPQRLISASPVLYNAFSYFWYLIVPFPWESHG